jgi:hypothetical protein
MGEMPTRLLMLLLALLLAAAAPSLPSRLNDRNTTEGWIWQQVQTGEGADLNDWCGSPSPDIDEHEYRRWQAPCRRVDPELLRALLTQPDLADHAPHGVRIRGARIDEDLDLGDAHVQVAEFRLVESWIAGDVDLSNARLAGDLGLTRTMFSGSVDLRDAHVDGQMSLEGASIADQQTFDAARLRVGAGGLFLGNVKFGGPVNLLNAHVEGRMSMEGANIADQQTFDAERLRVGAGGLFLDNVKFGGPVNLFDAHVEGRMSMVSASVADQQTFDAWGLHVGTGGLFLNNVKFGGPVNLRDARAGGLLLHQVTFGGPVNLRGAHVEGRMSMVSASVADKQTFDATWLHVGTGGLFLDNMKFGGPVDLGLAQIDGQMSLDGASIADQQTFDAEGLHIGSSFFARSVTFGGDVDFAGLAVEGALDLRDSHVRQVDLSNAVIRDDLQLGGFESWLHWDVCDGPAPCLNLRNARVGNLQDDDLAWPPRITLEGFTYTHLGGFGGEQRQDMRNRPIDWWRGWLSRDPVYSAQPYAQLASVLTAAGNRDGAADIRFFGRDRERTELLRGCTWLQELGLVEKPDSPNPRTLPLSQTHLYARQWKPGWMQQEEGLPNVAWRDTRPCGWNRWGAWIGLTALQYFVGYGIGAYNFRAVGWALLLALIGTVILCFAPGVRGVRPTYAGMAKAPRGPRQKSLPWCFGASLNRLLPLVTISQEFNDFFSDPKRERLRPGQHFAFGVLALCGWALGLFVVAAFSGLIQN